jgi:putative acetyltransferase
VDGEDRRVVSALVEQYLRQTEEEKEEFDVASGASADRFERYRVELEDTAAAYRGHDVLIAEASGVPAGIVVVRPAPSYSEVKRLYVLPRFRGNGLGARLLDTAIKRSPMPMRLTVWDWRLGAIRLYESRGFTVVPSWERRARLVCMELHHGGEARHAESE